MGTRDAGAEARLDAGVDGGGLDAALPDGGRDAGATDSGVDAGTRPSDGGAPAVHVRGNHLVDEHGTVLQLRGVNRSGAEYACADGSGFFDGPTDDDESVAAMRSWHINAVRLPMNEACWLGIQGVPAAYAGAKYQTAMVNYVKRLNAHGLVVVLNLHFSKPGNSTSPPVDQSPMADLDHSIDFWASVAAVFKSNPSVLLDLFNEPFPDNNADTTAAWGCVLNGGTCAGVPYLAAGMQSLVSAVRSAGATQPVLIAGPQYAGVVDRWEKYTPTDPLDQLVASIHIYGKPLDSPCRAQTCWNSDLATLAATTPVVIGEFGDTDCTATFSPGLMAWADAHGISYLAWAWNVANCAKDPSLITSYDGTPTPYGMGVRDHLRSLP